MARLAEFAYGTCVVGCARTRPGVLMTARVPRCFPVIIPKATVEADVRLALWLTRHEQRREAKPQTQCSNGPAQ